METQKPKKALRSLFSRTEPEVENIAPKIQEKNSGNKKIIGASAGRKEEKVEVKKSQVNLKKMKELEVKESSENVEEKKINLSAPTSIKLKSEEESANVKEKEDSHLSENNIVRIENKNELMKAEEKQTARSEVIVGKEIASNEPYSFVKIQYNIDLFQTERTTWNEADYVSFIHKIDQAQTDAFFLKGKLVSEIKDKFYLENKRGWALFCDETLNINYTTANQYIRVAQEFDVTSHQRRDFGFEHFKALLPLGKSERNEILLHTPQNLSVKSLRDIVSKKLLGSSDTHIVEKRGMSSKGIIQTLQKLKAQLHSIKDLNLSQEEKWQLYGAFQNLSEDMKSISNSFMEIPEKVTDTSI